MTSPYLIDQRTAVAHTGAAFDPQRSQILKRGLFDVYDGGREMWVVLDEVIIWSHRLLKAIVIPRWFLTNFASIPKWARPLIEVNGRHRYAALAHDLLYSCYQLGFDIARDLADRVLLDFCAALGVVRWKRRAMWRAVKLGGASAYNCRNAVVMVPVAERQGWKDAHHMLFEWID